MPSWATTNGTKTPSTEAEKVRYFDLHAHRFTCRRVNCDLCAEYKRLEDSIHARDTGMTGRPKEDR